MSVRQGSSIIAGGIQIDNTPTSSSTNAVSSGGVYSALANKVSTGHEVIEFQAPTAQNNYTWYPHRQQPVLLMPQYYSPLRCKAQNTLLRSRSVPVSQMMGQNLVYWHKPV